MNKKTIITALLALVTMTGQAQSRVHYRLEGFIGDSTITGKAYLMDMFVHSGEIVDTVNISKGFIEPVEGELTDTTICQLLVGDLPSRQALASLSDCPIITFLCKISQNFGVSCDFCTFVAKNSKICTRPVLSPTRE